MRRCVCRSDSCVDCSGLCSLQGVSARRMPAALELPPSLVLLTLDQVFLS